MSPASENTYFPLSAGSQCEGDLPAEVHLAANRFGVKTCLPNRFLRFCLYLLFSWLTDQCPAQERRRIPVTTTC